MAQLLEMRVRWVPLILLYSLFLDINSWYCLFTNLSKRLLWLKSFFPEQLCKYVIINVMIYCESFELPAWLAWWKQGEQAVHTPPGSYPESCSELFTGLCQVDPDLQGLAKGESFMLFSVFVSQRSTWLLPWIIKQAHPKIVKIVGKRLKWIKSLWCPC